MGSIRFRKCLAPITRLFTVRKLRDRNSCPRINSLQSKFWGSNAQMGDSFRLICIWLLRVRQGQRWPCLFSIFRSVIFNSKDDLLLQRRKQHRMKRGRPPFFWEGSISAVYLLCGPSEKLYVYDSHIFNRMFKILSGIVISYRKVAVEGIASRRMKMGSW
jgi:hypothetical protein